ncbi:hypothetical protein CBD41_04335, partial [bacterium TMED181]
MNASASISHSTRSLSGSPSPLLLSLRSWGSLLRGHQPMEALIDQARKQGWRHFAVTEIAELGTCVEAARHTASGIPPHDSSYGSKAGSAVIVGTELPCRNRIDSVAETNSPQSYPTSETSLLILPINPEGLVEVHQTVSDWCLSAPTQNHRDSCAAEKPSLTAQSPPETILPVPENDLELLCQLSECWLITGDPTLAMKLLQMNPEIASRLILEVDRWGSSLSHERQILECARKHQLRLVAGARLGGSRSLSAHQTHLLDALSQQSTIDDMADRRRQQQRIPFSPGQLLPIP